MEVSEIKNIEEAVDYLFPFFEGMDEYFKQDEDYFASFCHSQLSGGIGMKIRNMLGFWTQDTPVYFNMRSLGLEDPDDMSDLIIRKIYKKYNENKTRICEQ